MRCYIFHKGNKYPQKDVHKIRPTFRGYLNRYNFTAIILKASI